MPLVRHGMQILNGVPSLPASPSGTIGTVVAPTICRPSSTLPM